MATDAQAYLVCSCYSHMEFSKGIHIIILKYNKKINSEKKNGIKKKNALAVWDTINKASRQKSSHCGGW